MKGSVDNIWDFTEFSISTRRCVSSNVFKILLYTSPNLATYHQGIIITVNNGAPLLWHCKWISPKILECRLLAIFKHGTINNNSLVNLAIVFSVHSCEVR